MNTLKIAGKFLDQPLLVEKFRKAVPVILTGGASVYAIHEINKNPQDQRKKSAIRIISTMALTIASAVAAPKITDKIIKDFDEIPKNINQIKKEAEEIISNFVKTNEIDKKTAEILNKAKSKVLKFTDLKHLYKTFDKNPEGMKLLNKLIPDPENITSKEIFSEIKRLSLLGFIPVAGGITGGILGDFLSGEKWKQRVPDKIKEGSYQYLANIFLCNIGAGAALGIMEKFKVKSKTYRALGMIAGILATGVAGGSTLANLIGNKIINPIFNKEKGNSSIKNLYDERVPEAIDIGLHVDDIATVAVLSGLKWIEPALPLMYAISGYRAGIGYRNGQSAKHSDSKTMV